MTDIAKNVEPTDSSSDSELVVRVIDEDITAYEDIMRRYNQRMFRLARSIVTDDAAAMDVVQNAYIQAFEHISELKNRDALGSWLARIVRNAALMHLRKTRRYETMDDSEVEKVLHLSRPEVQQMRPDRELANTQLRQVLEDCIDELPDAFRAVFMLRAVEQCSVQSVSEILGIKEATVKTRFHRARMLLQGKLVDLSDVAQASVHEFAGHRCDTIVRNVLSRLRKTGKNARRRSSQGGQRSPRTPRG